MFDTQLLDPVQILKGSKEGLREDAVLIDNGHLKAFGAEARKQAKELSVKPTPAQKQLIAPCLVDPHSVLEDPINGQSENIKTLSKKAFLAGYGQIALLPRSKDWRDRPARIRGFINSCNGLRIHFWGGFSLEGKGEELSPHADLIQQGAIGLAEDNSIISTALIKKGLVLAEMGSSPVLFAPRDIQIQGDGIVREGIETLRAGWAPDPIASETIPLGQLLELHRQHPEVAMRLMNISTADGVSMLSKSTSRPIASVNWWHLIADSSNMPPTDIGWRVSPSIGSAKDRNALIQGLKKGTLTAVAVNSIPLDEVQTQLPPDQRSPGISGYQLVLPALWQELVVKSNWTVEKLWEVLSFGPSKMLNMPEEFLQTGSRRWLHFDPDKRWVQSLDKKSWPFAANQAWEGKQIKGKVINCGLKSQVDPSD